MVIAAAGLDFVAEPAFEGPTDWMDDASCRGSDPELFFPEGDDTFSRARTRTAKLICRQCPVSLACLEWAIDSGQEAGIWGGRTTEERRQLQRRRRRWS